MWPILKSDYKRIKELKLDIIHTMHFFTLGSYGMRVANKLNLPIVHTYHTNYQEYAKNYVPLISSLAEKYLIYRSRVYCNQCDLIISPSPSMAKVIRSYGVRTRVEPLPTGINLNDFSSIGDLQFRKKYGIRKEGKLLLYVGRVGEEKNVKFLIDSFDRVLKKADSNLILVGSGSKIEYYKDLVRKYGIEKKVYFLGFLPKKETNAIFGACDLFVFPSLTDTQGIVIIEAMASGLVPVAMNRLGPSDTISDGYDGLLSSLNKTDFSKNIIKLLLDDNLRQRLSRNAKKTAKKYSQEKITQKLLDLYELAKKNFNDKRINNLNSI